MDTVQVVARRLQNQLLTSPPRERPEDVVAHFGAMQAQDFVAARWAVGLRCRDITDSAVEEAFNRGAILRTHVLRPTWHFVTPADIRWILALTSPRVHQGNVSQYRRMDLEPRLLGTTSDIIARSLANHTWLTRDELRQALVQTGISIPTALHLTYIVMHAELDGLICSGPRRGKQFTYALLDERAPGARTMDREESLAELARRYLTAHGPATPSDFAWWSSLTVADARAGFEMNRPDLASTDLDGTTYWYAPHHGAPGYPDETLLLLPNYDEYVVGYTDRSLICDVRRVPGANPRSDPVFQHTIVDRGRVIGTWRRTLAGGHLTVAPSVFDGVSVDAARLDAAIDRYARFLC